MVQSMEARPRMQTVRKPATVSWGLLLVLAAWVCPAQVLAQSAPDRQKPVIRDGVVYISTQRFKLPLRHDAELVKQLKGIRLYVSVNEGKTWVKRQSIAPTRDFVEFKSEKNGHYWITLARVDLQGQQHPADVSTTDEILKVTIDSVPPRLDLMEASTDTDWGVKWMASDIHLEPSTFQLAVRLPGNTSWSPVPANRQSAGSYRWSKAMYPDGLEVQAQVSDIGRLTTVQNLTLKDANSPAVARRPEAVPAGMTSNKKTPAVGGELPSDNRLVASEGIVPPPPVGSTQDPRADFTPEPPAATQNPIASNQDTSAPVTDHHASRPTWDRSKPDLPAKPPSRKPSIKHDTEVQQASTKTPSSAMHDADRIPVASTRTPLAQTSAKMTPELEETKPAPAPAPPEPKIHLLRSPRFALNYRLSNVGPSGVGSVKMYVTKDDGQTWMMFGMDEDRRPPFEVELPGEGRYGVAIVVTSPAGYGMAPPKPGEAPKLLLEVDTTAPDAALFTPVPDPKAPHQALVIPWQAKDKHLADRPVDLYFAEFPEGPWYAIKTGLPPTGSYSWLVPKDVPYRVYLRLVARDMVGNEGVADTPEPVVVDLSRPQAEVIGIANMPKDDAPKRK